MKHYLQVTDSDFALALKGGAECGAQVAQNTAQRVSADQREVEQETTQAPDESEAYALSRDMPRDVAQIASCASHADFEHPNRDTFCLAPS
ncbi:MAG: hypothetical protein ACYC4U_33205 [Pirellulaceae bacterium]